MTIKQWPMIRTLVAVLFFALVACNGNKNAGSNGTDLDDVELGGDADAGDASSGDSGPQCEPNQIPNAHGDCVTLCQGTEDCHDVLLVCNLELGVCIPKPPECNPVTCAEGFTCPPAGQGTDCIPLPEGFCNVDEDCGILERCVGGECISRAGDVVATCVVAQDCPIGMACELGLCVGCLDDIQCQLSYVNGKCVLGTCVIADLGPPGECINLECAEGQVCALTTGQCANTCTAETEAERCTAEERCLPVANYCVAEFGCTTTADCVGGETGGRICVLGLCTNCLSDEECQASEQCIKPAEDLPGACFPNLTGNVCDTVTCPDSELCDPANGLCYPANGTCVDATDCRPGHTCNFLHLCAGCTVDGDCRANQRCLLSTCIPIPTGG